MKRVIFYILGAVFMNGPCLAAMYVNLSKICMTNGLAGCIIDNDVCYWCGTTPPPGNCKKGYAGCLSESYIISPNGGDRLYTADGYYGYSCYSSGWSKVRQDFSCRDTEYMSNGAYNCLKCPSSGIFFDGPGGRMEVPSRVNANHHYEGVSACCAEVAPRMEYSDSAGVFEFDSDCCYSGEEPIGGEPDDSADWCS